MVIIAIYALALIFAILLTFGYILRFEKREGSFILLFGLITFANLGYLLTSLARSLEFALFANTLSYFGSVFLPMIMLLILLDSLGKQVKKSLSYILTGLSVAVFLITATQLIPGLDLYYKEATLLFTEDGAAYLHKEYGPLHALYPVYLFGYFAAMIYLSLDAILKKKVKSGKQTAALLIAVFVNLCVWLAEQFATFELEFLAISYLISEIFLLIFRQMLLEVEDLKEQLRQKELELKRKTPSDEMQLFINGLRSLTMTEKVVLEHYVKGLSSSQIMAEMFISQNTLKYHNKNIYSKCYVSSRKELLEKYQRAMRIQDEHYL